MQYAAQSLAPVSVLVPTYNRANFLPETIDSILSQSYSPGEVIVVDDGSTDNTREIMASLYPRVKYHRIANSGVCAARNRAASLATLPYIAFCDSDDLWRQDKLEKQMELHHRYPELQHSFTNFSIVTDGVWSKDTKFDNAPQSFFGHCEERLPNALVCDRPLYDEILRFQPVFQSTLLMTRDFFYKIGGYTESLGRALSEDLEFALRWVRYAPIGIIMEPLAGIRKHSGNFSGNTLATTRGEVEILRYALSSHGVTESTREILLDQIALRNISASYDAFADGKFAICENLLASVPAHYLTPKLRLKLLISRSPEKVAQLLKRILVRS
jgi:hypothetical protein